MGGQHPYETELSAERLALRPAHTANPWEARCPQECLAPCGGPAGLWGPCTGLKSHAPFSKTSVGSVPSGGDEEAEASPARQASGRRQAGAKVKPRVQGSRASRGRRQARPPAGPFCLPRGPGWLCARGQHHARAAGGRSPSAALSGARSATSRLLQVALSTRLPATCPREQWAPVFTGYREVGHWSTLGGQVEREPAPPNDKRGSGSEVRRLEAEPLHSHVSFHAPKGLTARSSGGF